MILELLEKNSKWKSMTHEEQKKEVSKFYWAFNRSQLTPERRKEISYKALEARKKKYGEKGWKKDKKTGKYNLGVAFASNITKNK